MRQKIYKTLSQILIISLIICNNCFYTFADSIDNLVDNTISASEYNIDSVEQVEHENQDEVTHAEESDINDYQTYTTVEITDVTTSERFEEENDENIEDVEEENIENENLISPDTFYQLNTNNNSSDYAEEPEEDEQIISTEENSESYIEETENTIEQTENTEGTVENIEVDESTTTVVDSSEEMAQTEATTTVIPLEFMEDFGGIDFKISTDSDTYSDDIFDYDEEIISTTSELEDILLENQDLVDMLAPYGIIIDNYQTFEFMRNLEYEYDGPYLLAKMNDYYFEVNNQFVDKYARKNIIKKGLFGAAGDTSVTLDFGDINPQMSDCSNSWQQYGSGVGQTITFSGPEGAVIYTTIKTEYPNLPVKTYGSYSGTDAGKHVVLPTFANDLWDGFKFEGWLDEDNNNLNITQQGTFFYSFPYGNSITYTASWVKDTTKDEVLNIKYYRTINSSENFDIVTEFNQTKKHGDYIFMDPPQVNGYKVTSMVIANVSRSSAEYADLGADGLKTKDFNGNFIQYAETVELISDYTLMGRIPNHDLFIEYYYEPDNDQKNQFTIYYYSNTSYEELKVSSTQLVLAESVVTANPALIDHYQFLRAEVEETPEDPSTGIYGLGHFHTSDEKYTTEQVNAANGAFKAIMPNQEVVINYYYQIDSTLEEPMNVVTEIQQEDGTYDVSTVSSMVRLGEDNTHTVTVDDKRDEGYGMPIISNKNVIIQSYNADTGALVYYIDNFDEHVLTITYAIDYTSDYWTKLGFNVLADGHGTIAPIPGSNPLTERYIKRNETYDLADLLSGVDITVDQYYKCVWYKNKTSGIGPSGNPLPETGIQITGSNYNLFASFEEDPDWWVDINFSDADHCSITGTSQFHLLKNTGINTITFPTVVVETGYRHYNNEWLDETGAVLGTTFIASHSYIPNIKSKFSGSADAVKPVAHVTYDANGIGTANLYGVYEDRNYVLTDSGDRVLVVKNATNAKNGFGNLSQGMTYHLYELLSTVAIPAIGDSITTSEPNISQKYVFGVRALNGNYNINSDGSTITVSPKANTTYALLDDRYNIINDWTTSPTFTGLDRGTYYLVVAKNTSSSLDADSEEVIRNGEVIYTSTNDLSQRKYRLIIFGVNAYAQNAGSVTSMGGAKVYQVAEGTQVTVRGQNNYKMYCVTNNVAINENSISNVFAMPASDVVFTNYNSSDNDINKINIDNDGAKISILNIESIKNTLNSANVISQAVTDNCPMVHNVLINRYATNKAYVQSLGNGNGKVAPYEYTIDVQTVVMGNPYKNSKESTTNFTSYLAFDKSMIGNDSFGVNSGSFNCLYTNDSKQMGMASIDLSSTTAKSIYYTKNHKVNVKSTTAGLAYNEDFYIADGQKLNTAANYSNLENKMTNIFDDGAANVAKEYIYNNLTLNGNVFDIDNTNITKQQNLVLSYTLNQDREDIKTSFSQEIYNANQKYSALSYNASRTTLMTAIQNANNIRNAQKNYSVADLTAARDEIRQAYINTNDPIVMINIDPNGGELSHTSIDVMLGDSHKYATLSIVTATRENYRFVSWNTTDDGTGINVTPDTIVGQNAYDLLFAIWEEAPYDPSTDPTGGGGTHGGAGGGGGGAGGGGGGTGSTKTQLLKQQLPIVNPVNLGENTVDIPNGVTEFFKSRSSLVYENGSVGAFLFTDPNTKLMNLRIGNKDTQEVYKGQWVTVFSQDNTSRTYRADKDGNVIVGKYVDEDNFVYYLNDEDGKDFGVVQTGWIFDDKLNCWYYANPINGTIVTGWQSINGKDYYFYKPDQLVNNGLGVLDKYNRNMYGVMLKNTITPDGFILGPDGARIEDKPYLLYK